MFGRYDIRGRVADRSTQMRSVNHFATDTKRATKKSSRLRDIAAFDRMPHSTATDNLPRIGNTGKRDNLESKIRPDLLQPVDIASSVPAKRKSFTHPEFAQPGSFSQHLHERFRGQLGKVPIERNRDDFVQSEVHQELNLVLARGDTSFERLGAEYQQRRRFEGNGHRVHAELLSPLASGLDQCLMPPMHTIKCSNGDYSRLTFKVRQRRIH